MTVDSIIPQVQSTSNSAVGLPKFPKSSFESKTNEKQQQQQQQQQQLAFGKQAKIKEMNSKIHEHENEIPDNTNETISFEELISKIFEQLGTERELKLDEIPTDLLINYLKSYISDEKDWAKYAFQNSNKPYTRNGIEDISINANLLILVWSPHNGSYIHDHANAHCIMKILKGTLTEHLYEMPLDPDNIAKSSEEIISPDGSAKKYYNHHELKPYNTRDLEVNQVAYIHDKIGLHRIRNNTDEPAISLHLYTPPYAKLNGCNYYESKTGIRHHIDMSKLFSWKGEVIHKNDSSSC
ncbi:unnamed protein product [[Candida] boidinii]|uniref:Cysteine dioxygenase n=1 Tax=Candida boidinii TaxID=5477 RepID=A0A9W6WIV1_CANBO|nr:dioxygenase activity protein [[Candida] boidinii]GME75592.1 unnamed protein product [[Candida] boidinii]GMG20432.1 unnamed protein product [[Candida] boidinii]